jgi:mevalonate kinase
LQRIEVSSPELERLVEAARAAGALGAKLSGGGKGGNMIALVAPPMYSSAESAPLVAQALREAGAARTIITEVR